MADAAPRSRLGLGKPGNHNRAVQSFGHMVASTHYHATQAGLRILDAGGNAVDAGVATGLCLGVLQSDIVNPAGVAPITFYQGSTGRVVTIAGLGPWPRAASVERFRKEFDGRIPPGILRTVVPAAPDAWITALREFGTMSFGEVARQAIAFARDGFPMHALMSNSIKAHLDAYRRWPSNTAIYLPGGMAPEPGERFVQAEMAASLQYMADQEKAAAAKGRDAGLAAARDAFYRGDIAAKILAFHREQGGWLSAEDLNEYRSPIEPPTKASFREFEVYTCGPWCQGPVLLQLLKLVERENLGALGWNSPDYIHVLTEAVKLAFADRDAYFGDPRQVDVPMAALTSDAYAELRRTLIDRRKAWPELPPAGDPRRGLARIDRPAPELRAADPHAPGDTAYVCAADKHGNVFSATPSDSSYDQVVVPGTGLTVSGRGSQSFTIPGHPSEVAPGRRPRLTPNPALAISQDNIIAFGTPGGDVQTQAMLQTLLNVVVHGMDVQEAVEAPRFASYSYPSSFEPHDYHPGLLRLENRLPKATGEDLAARGHKVEWWPDMTWLAGAVCMIVKDRETGLMIGGADPRRHSAVAAG